jgi:hypothetical protein
MLELPQTEDGDIVLATGFYEAILKVIVSNQEHLHLPPGMLICRLG